MANAPAPNLLNDDGTASMATAFLMSHHGFRRDLARFAVALAANTVAARADALRDEWKSFHAALHGHHTVEDTGIFPSMRAEHPSLAATIDKLTVDHRRIDPLLERADQAFAKLPDAGPAAAVIAELSELLDAHLALEEAEVVPFLRDARQFPTPRTDAEAEMYAAGFSWSAHGVAADVLKPVFAMLPEIVASRLPAARVAFDVRCERVWGTAKAGASHTSVPESA